VLWVDSGEGKYELQPFRRLLDVHGWLPHRRIRARSYVADKLPLHAVGPVQELTGLCPHPAKLAINAHVRLWAPPNLPKEAFNGSEGEWWGVK